MTQKTLPRDLSRVSFVRGFPADRVVMHAFAEDATTRENGQDPTSALIEVRDPTDAARALLDRYALPFVLAEVLGTPQGALWGRPFASGEGAGDIAVRVELAGSRELTPRLVELPKGPVAGMGCDLGDVQSLLALADNDLWAVASCGCDGSDGCTEGLAVLHTQEAPKAIAKIEAAEAIFESRASRNDTAALEKRARK